MALWSPKEWRQVAGKGYGGNVQGDMNGFHQFTVELQAMVAHIVRDEEKNQQDGQYE